MLADFGADVIRIEPPMGVDSNANMFADVRLGGDFQNLNRNKRSLTLNLKKPEAKDIFYKMVKDADVVVENWRPDVKERLGVDYETLKKINPRIILASISGFGQSGPYVKRPGFDQIVQGMGGMMSVTGLPGQGPVRAGIAVADSSAGLYTALGIMTALLEREHSGEGQWVHTSLLHAQIAMLDFQAARYLNEGDVPVQAGNDHPTSSPMGLFHSSDGDFNIGVSGDGQWLQFCKALEKLEWVEDPRFKTVKDRRENRQKLNALIQEIFSTQSVNYWVDLLNAFSVPSGPVYTVPEMFKDPQIQSLGVYQEVDDSDIGKKYFITQPVTLSRTTATVAKVAPKCGEHTDEILGELNYSEEEISHFHDIGAV
jgi:crotonobetainyl-CoA:carnitine CoA-transferase CaiB-like acyl-CoA transferase